MAIDSLIGVIVVLAMTITTMTVWWFSIRAHQQKIDSLDIRIHVNGIRGKSSVTRLIAGILREGGYVTVAKTTGSAARVISPNGHETPIKRNGAPTIYEQVDIVRKHVHSNVDALVIECMAVRPLYQSYSQEFIVRSDITVVTNVRADHQEEMGETLTEIADSLALTTPRNGLVITAESNPDIRAQFQQWADKRNSQLIYADPRQVDDDDMTGFDYIQFKENVAIGYHIADYLNIPRSKALQGMWKSVPDVGVVRLRWYDVNGKKILWIPLFATNDRESVILTFILLQAYFPDDATVIGILNNRLDRPRRAQLFADMVPTDLDEYLDQVVLMGALDDVISRSILDQGFSADRLHLMGESVSPTLDQMLADLTALIPGDTGVIVGMVNIHSEQAEKLIHYFNDKLGAEHTDELSESRKLSRSPLALQKAQRAVRRSALRDADSVKEETFEVTHRG